MTPDERQPVGRDRDETRLDEPTRTSRLCWVLVLDAAVTGRRHARSRRATVVPRATVDVSRTAPTVPEGSR